MSTNRAASRRTRVRQSVRRAGLIVSVAGASASLAAQTPQTGWEGVRPTGWPGQAASPSAAASPAPSTPETVVATTARAASPTVSRSRGEGRPSRARARRKARGAGGKRTAPAWITLEWDAPPPVDIALDWSRPTLDATPRTLVLTLPASPASGVFWRESHEPAGASDATAATAAADEARLPVATMICASALPPAAPRQTTWPRAAEGESRPRVSGFRALMGRMADALGLRRNTAAAAAPRVASAEGASVQ
jgi:hypothetical protein